MRSIDFVRGKDFAPDQIAGIAGVDQSQILLADHCRRFRLTQ
jgi:hypothetical protein